MTFPFRASGILLHPTALPGSYGIGTLGNEAAQFIQWLKDAGQSYWQICPLTPTGYGDSPYQGFSAFAGNPNMIDLEILQSQGFLVDLEIQPLRDLPHDRVDFGRLIPLKEAVLRKAWQRFSSGQGPEGMKADFNHFRLQEASWLEDFCLFMTIKNKENGRPWNEWPQPLRFRENKALNDTRALHTLEIEYHAFIQYLFFQQWNNLKALAASNGIRIIGDLPIFTAYDSSDCWANPGLFQLDENLVPTRVAGVPPDYFSSTGQLWGNPLYDWDIMEQNGFSWWISVLRSKLLQYDALRIDHFRGFSAYWSVPFGDPTAEHGQWIPAPGRKLFKRVRKELGELPIIAEELGLITEDVIELIDEFGFPGMKVLQFAFDSSEDNDYLPHNYNRNSLVYTGTHDNNTTIGWFLSADASDRAKTLAYLNLPAGSSAATVTSAMIRTAMASVCNLAVIPLQDVLELEESTRFNTPGTLGNNWIWRVDKKMLNNSKTSELLTLVALYGRVNS